MKPLPAPAKFLGLILFLSLNITATPVLAQDPSPAPSPPPSNPLQPSPGSTPGSPSPEPQPAPTPPSGATPAPPQEEPDNEDRSGLGGLIRSQLSGIKYFDFLGVTPTNGNEEDTYVATVQCETGANWKILDRSQRRERFGPDEDAPPLASGKSDTNDYFDVNLGLGSNIGVGRHELDLICSRGLVLKSEEFPISVAEGDTERNSSGRGFETVTFTEQCPEGYVESPIGRIPCGTPEEFVGWVLERALGIAGFVALMVITFGGYKIMFSQGDSGKIAEGRDHIQNALIGLVFIILSAVILRIIGGGLIGIPIIG